MTNPADKLSLLMATPNEEPVSQYKGVVQQTDDSKAYVLIDGGTAVWCDTMDVKALVGDRVRVEVRKHKGTLVANYTHPVTDDAVANVANGKATEALEKVETLEVDALKADSAVIKNLQADTAKVHDLTADQLSAATAYVGELTAGEVTAQSIIADKAKLAQVDTDQLHADHAVIETLDTTYASIGSLNAATARIGDIEADYLKTADMEAERARVGQLVAGKADVADLTAANARIDSLESTKADISFLESDYITAEAIEATYLHADMSNADVAWIQNGVIKDGSISNAMINSLSANKLTAGTINGETINVTNINADNITAGTINGQRIGEGSLSLDKLSEDVYTEQEVDNKLSAMQAEIDGAIETWTGTDVPTLNNSPASGWNTSDERDRHVGDVYFVVNSNSQQNGYNYRFTKSGNTYSWQLIKDSDVTNALQRLSTAEGKITTFDSDISTLKTDTGTLKTKTESLETRMSDAEDDILDKVDTTTFNEVSDTVDQHSQTITQMSQTLSNKADGSTVTALTTRVSKTEQDITGVNTTIGELQTTVESKADSSTVETVSNKLNTVSDTVDGHTQSITSINNTLETKADSSTVSTLTTKVNNVSDTVDGHTQTIGSMQTTQTQMQGKLDKTIVETTQLWYSKSSTDAPSKPTSQVTSTSTAGNAWRTVVPAYNASYPNYFYCYQWKYTDGTYGWSSVTRDIAMGESQERARTAISNAAAADTKAGNAASAAATAQTTADGAKTTADTAKATADKNVKSSLQLWFTKGNETAPAKPTSKVTSTSVSGNAWRTVVPTYSASYPYYFYCYQYELADGTYTWSDVVYDRATTENQSNSRSAVSGVSTLTTKTNEISDTVDGHTSQLSSITTTQTSIQGSAVKSTVQLWFTKANTTAPSKPTAHVTTNNASTANDWNLAVPTYNASYPYYYYCYEHQLLNDTYTWSAVTRDMATEESQSTSRSAASAAAAADTKAGNAASAAAAADTKAGNAAAAAATADGKAVSAQNTANKNVRESQQLWYTKANSTAPAKPTSKVTSTATTGGAWTTRVPTYSDDYKHYFYCMQYVAADNTVTWSDVIYDQATTEAQSVARAASADLTEFHQEYATFKQTTQRFESTVGETYATKTALNATDSKIENLEIGVRNLLGNTENRSGSAIVANSAASSTFGSIGNYNDAVSLYSLIDYDGYSNAVSCATSTSTGNRGVGWYTKAGEIRAGETYTFSCRIKCSIATNTHMHTAWRNGSATSGYTGWSAEGTKAITAGTWTDYSCTFTPNSSAKLDWEFFVAICITGSTSGATYQVAHAKLEKGNRATDWTPAPEDTDSQLSSIEERVSTAETSITNNSREIGLRAKASDVYTKTESDGLINTEVTNRNAAIKASADAINLSVKETYATKSEASQTANLAPYFSMPKDDVYNASSNPYGYWKRVMTNSQFTTYDMQVEHNGSDGWCHIAGNVTSGNPFIRFEPMPIATLKASSRYTFVLEIDGTFASGITNVNWVMTGGQSQSDTRDAFTSEFVKHGVESGTFFIAATTASDLSQMTGLSRGYVQIYGSGTFDAYFRISLYEGEYKGSYKPYVGTQLYPTNSRMSAAETLIEQNAEAIKLTATKEEVEKTYATKDDSQLDRAGSGTSVAIDGAATALLKGLHVIGESVQDGTPTPSAPKPIYSVGSPNMVNNSDVRLVSTYGSKTDSTSCVLTRTIPKGTMITVSCRIEATNVTWAGSGSRRAGVEINQPTDGTSSGTQYVGVWWGISGSNHQGSDANFSGTLSAQVRLTRDFVADGSRALGVYIQNITGGSITVSEPSLTVGFFKPYVPSGSIGLLVNGRNMLRLASAGRYTNVAANGITWTMNDDGTVSAKGTSTGISQAFWSFGLDELLTFDGMELSGCPSVSGCSLRLEKDTSPYTAYAVDTGNGATVSIPSSVSGNAYLFCRVDSGKTVDVTFRPMIRRPSQPNEYEPYNGTVIPIPFNGHELRSLPDGTRDELTVDVDGHVTMTQRVGAYRMADYASYTWNKSSSATNGYYIYYYQLPESDRFAPYASGDGNVYSNMASPASTASEYFAGPNKLWHDSSLSFNLDGSVVGTTVAAFKTWLASSELMAYAPLFTPQTIDLGTIDMPQVHDGDTVEVIAALTPSIDVTWWASAGQAVADAYASLSSAIEVRAESIVSTVSERYATSDDVKAISSQIEQTAQGWGIQFKNLLGTPVDGQSTEGMTLAKAFEQLGVTEGNLEQIRSYVRIAEETVDNQTYPVLLMGSANSPIMLALSNKALEFRQGDTKVAWIEVVTEDLDGDGVKEHVKESLFHIEKGVVDKELQFGSWKWFERDGVGNLALKWVGDE